MTLTEAINILSSVDESLGHARQRHLAENDNDEFPYILIEDYARIIYTWIEEEKTQRLAELFAAVEQVLTSDDVSAQALVQIGLFEALQKRAASAGASMEIVSRHFGPAAKEIWGEHEDFWSGAS